MRAVNVDHWWDRFLEQLQVCKVAEPLREASLAERLTDWTRLTTEAVVNTCHSVGWEAAARGHRSNRLPESASEYLALDAMAFPHRDSSDTRWPMPTAVFELENSPRDDRVGYSLWKVLCVRAPLRVVFAYRRDWSQTRSLMDYLAADVVSTLAPTERMGISGDTAVITGSRGESETFPHGYFKLWKLDPNLGKFERR